MKAPVLGKVLFESTKPYVIAEVLGASNRLPQIRLNVRPAKQITRFIGISFSGMKAWKGLVRENSTTGGQVPQARPTKMPRLSPRPIRISGFASIGRAKVL